jgi:hypothetical protein
MLTPAAWSAVNPEACFETHLAAFGKDIATIPLLHSPRQLAGTHLTCSAATVADGCAGHSQPPPPDGLAISHETSTCMNTKCCGGVDHQAPESAKAPVMHVPARDAKYHFEQQQVPREVQDMPKPLMPHSTSGKCASHMRCLRPVPTGKCCNTSHLCRSSCAAMHSWHQAVSAHIKPELVTSIIGQAYGLRTS